MSLRPKEPHFKLTWLRSRKPTSKVSGYFIVEGAVTPEELQAVALKEIKKLSKSGHLVTAFSLSGIEGIL